MSKPQHNLLSRFRGTLIALAVVALLVGLDRSGLFDQGPSGDKDNPNNAKGYHNDFFQGDMSAYNGKSFRVVKCVDGDTIDIAAADKRAKYGTTRIRLWGVDTPETVKRDRRVEHFGPEASAFTKAACMGKTVRLELVSYGTRGQHGRLLAYVYLPDGRCLNQTLIEKGLGYGDPRYNHPRINQYARAMKQAKKAKLGLWKNPVPADWPYYLPDSPNK